ncbi:MAG: hypothetical protein CM1200mP40_35170 [Gammaproteobacteria bacterium]|nr:MAG: hypothetical protein CM1200mP40_35170 [Gammaproteobacteria bacterium]
MSVVATGGGLIFGGDANGRFRAFDHETGEVLWEINLGPRLAATQIFFAVDGNNISLLTPVAVSPDDTGITSEPWNKFIRICSTGLRTTCSTNF